MSKAKISKLCNEIDDIVSHIESMNTNFATEVQLWNIHNKIKEISAEITAPPKSNADRIRQMTDEELAESLSGSVACRHVNDCLDTSCYECTLIWLKQEVSEDAGSKTD